MCFIKGVLSRDGEEGKQDRAKGKDLSTSVVLARDHHSVDPTLKQVLAFSSPDWSVISYGLPLGKGA